MKPRLRRPPAISPRAWRFSALEQVGVGDAGHRVGRRLIGGGVARHDRSGYAVADQAPGRSSARRISVGLALIEHVSLRGLRRRWPLGPVASTHGGPGVPLSLAYPVQRHRDTFVHASMRAFAAAARHARSADGRYVRPARPGARDPARSVGQAHSRADQLAVALVRELAAVMHQEAPRAAELVGLHRQDPDASAPRRPGRRRAARSPPQRPPRRRPRCPTVRRPGGTSAPRCCPRRDRPRRAVARRSRSPSVVTLPRRRFRLVCRSADQPRQCRPTAWTTRSHGDEP